ncbi:hypothetical protein PENDEC_c032G05340 [Penicillium decumbens]|uniref:Uncharacterized protein n=1 Tax=Penicillium decumbens TaxID=69771 RepID=A0A1V6NVA5_PENDC|nr:hypothetical protein PENDEC_c032G05340 [Penicillium decumbens]
MKSDVLRARKGMSYSTRAASTDHVVAIRGVTEDNHSDSTQEVPYYDPKRRFVGTATNRQSRKGHLPNLVYDLADEEVFAAAWKVLKWKCERYMQLERHHHRPVWTTDDPPLTFADDSQGRGAHYASITERHKLYTKVKLAANGNITFPPPYVALSDELVYYIAKSVSLLEPSTGR